MHRLRGRFLLALAILAGLLTVAGAEPRATVTKLRIGEHPDKTRLVLHLTAPVAFSHFTLADPYRVVVDMPEVAWSLDDRSRPDPELGVAGFRYGLLKPGVARFVLDINRPFKVRKAFAVPPEGQSGDRIVLDLEPVSHDVFVALSEAALRERTVASVAAPVVPPPPIRRPSDGRRVIALDPGHGGVDPGAIGVSGLYEKELTLLMAKEAKRRLEASGRYRVVLTRESDTFLRLRERISMAREAGAELFISLHADAHPNPSLRGASVYTLSETASDSEAEALAAKENKADIIAGLDLSEENPEVTKLLIDLAQRETMNFSARFAAGLVEELGKETRLLKKTHRFAGFAVLKAADVPSVLFEMGYLSNREDERSLRTPAYRMRLVEAMLRAVDDHFHVMQAMNR